MKKLHFLTQLKFGKKRTKWLFGGIIAAYIVFVAIYYTIYSRDRVNYLMQNNHSIMISAAGNFQAQIDNINNMSRLIIANRNLARYLSTPAGELPAQRELVSDLYVILSAYPRVYSLIIIRPDNGYISSGIGVTEANTNVLSSPEWFQEVDDKSGGYVIKTNADGAFTTNTSVELLSFVRNINDLGTQKKTGMLAVNFPSFALQRSYQSYKEANRDFAFYSEKDQKFFSEDPQDSFQSILTELPNHSESFFQQTKGKTIFSAYRIPNMNLTLLCREKMNLSRILSTQITIVFAVLLLLVLVLLEVISELLATEESVKEKELAVLREQIKPHFLYNTLSTISSIALEKDDEAVVSSLETLGEFYRNFLSRGSTEIPLRSELEIVKDYLTLQKLRFKGLFEEEYEFDEKLLDYSIPKLILQPLVENSIYHGIQPKGEPGILRIKVYDGGEDICISIYDNGIGMSQEMIRNIMKEGNRISFGFKGTIERIQNYYNKKNVYEINSREGLYTEVILHLPKTSSKTEA